MARDFKIELDNVEMINGSDDLLKDTKVTKVTITGENKLNSLNSTFENCTELTSIEGEINLDGISDMTEMALNTTVDEIKVTNPTEENIQANDSLNQIGNVKIGGTKYSKGGVQDVVGSLEWNAENFTYEDTILENVYTNSSNVVDNKNITIQDTLEQKATSFEVTGQTYMNLVDGKNNQTLLDEMSMQQVEGVPTKFTPHMEQPICLEYIEGETYQNLIEGKGEYKLADTFSTTWTESNNSIENAPSMIEIPEIWGNTVQDESDLNIIQSVGDLYVDESGEPILDEEGNEQYKLEIKTHSKNYFSGNFYLRPDVDQMVCDDKIFVKPSTTYTLSDNLGYHYIVNQYNKKGVSLENAYPFSGDTIVTLDSCFYLLIRTYQNKGYTDINVQLQIEEGEVITEYEPYKEDKTTILMPQQLKGLSDVKDRLFYDYTKNMYIIENKIGNFNNINDLSEAILSIPKMIETKTLEKLSLETYSPKTYISTNIEIQPSKMTITNKKVDFIPLGLQANKDYTLQLDSTGKDDKPITVNLGGTETTIQPINDISKHHKVVVRTPSTLTTDKLDLSGEGVVVNDVMLFEGNTSVIKQDVDYIDGIQSIGELIENKNLFDYTQSKLGFLSISTGGISSNTDWKYTTNLISVKPNTTYCISQASNSEFYYNIVEYNSSQSYLKGTSWEENSGATSNRVYNTFTTSSNTYYIRLGWKVSSSNIQLEEGLIPTEFRVFGSERYKIEIETYDSRWDSI